LSNFLFYALEIFDCSSPDLKIEKLVDEPGNNHSSGPKVKPEDITPLSEDDSKTNNQSSCQDSLLSGNNYGTNCKIANMSKKNPDSGNSMSFDIYSLSVQDLGRYLHILNIGQYAEQLADAQIDGTRLKELDEKVLVEEFGFKRFEALTLMMFARHGYLPKNYRREEP